MADHLNDDEQLLAKLGYKQELNRNWSSFSNFAISFSIISILAGCFTTFGQAWNNGGPVAISWGWPIISLFILIIGFTMSELVSAYPTSGGIYWWAAKMGGPAAGFFTGWLNLIGLLAVTASVAYGCATFLDLTLSTISDGWAENYSLTRVYLIFVILLILAAGLNIFSGHLLAVLNNISVWWHVAGVAIVIAILALVPDKHQSIGFVFTERINNSGYDGGSIEHMSYWFLVLPLGFLLTQYTITGFDASAHLSEETSGAAEGAAKGIWRSIAYSALGGWVLLLAFLFAVQDKDGVTEGGGAVDVIFSQALPEGWHFIVLAISTAGQFFCTVACLTSASRMTFAFSRDGAIPGSSLWSKVNPQTKVPANAVMFVAVIGAIITLPALKGIGGIPIAFFAVTSVAVIGLYLAFLIPIYLRWRMGDEFEPGSWTNGPKYKWMNLVAVVEIAIICVYFVLPFVPAGIPFNDDFSWESVNYAPILTGGTLIALAIWWQVSAKNWFTGPKQTIDTAVTDAFRD
ncbi:amino acid permease [Aeromicrobium wangtongii]|uniref:Amino acid permease n=1 Tax=Aeromicrobium wangtongii TaxID=2969247 RepID=A0ABY5MAF0_9ACTN|nr:amino acid permease [Aeromicrobium wangtongii]MCD9199760.1 amino acid permease [Aeromicrobium wangtongii]UUP14109.1 amino acid permease [Aeromicrobium wangtongii]